MKILIEAMHGLGDVICMLPAIKAVRNNYPNAYIAVIVKFAAGKDLLEISNIKIDEIIVWNVYSDGLIKNINTVKNIRSQKYDYLINSVITPVKKAKLFNFILNPKKSIGLQHNIGKNFDGLGDTLHFVDANFIAIKDFCNVDKTEKNPRLYTDKNSINFTKEKILIDHKTKYLTGICIGCGDYSLKNRFLHTGKVFTRDWGINNIQKLIYRLLNKQCTVVLIGGKLEEVLLSNIDDKILKNSKVINCVNKTNIKESAALAAKCDVVVGVDTGMLHIAGAVGTKTVSVFGPTNPKTHGTYSNNAVFVENKESCKYCYGSKKYVNCKDRKCLSGISVDMVEEAVLKQLNLDINE